MIDDELRDSLLLDCYRTSDYPEVDEVAEAIWNSIDLPGRSWKTVEKKGNNKTLTCNFLDAYRNGKTIAYSRRTNEYQRPKRYGAIYFTYATTVPLMNAWRAAGITHQTRAGLWLPKGQGWVTEDDLTDFGRELFGSIPDHVTTRRASPSEVIVLKGRAKEGLKNKPLLDYEDTAETVTLRYHVEEYNELMRSTLVTTEDLRSQSSQDCSDWWEDYGSDWTLVDSQTYSSISDTRNLLDNEAYRVFNNGDWKQGGRYYGAQIQGLSEEARETARIDGKPTVERDFSGMLPRIAYHRAGKECPSDPYGIYDDDEARDICKGAVLICLSSSSKGKARNGIYDALYGECHTKSSWEKQQKRRQSLKATGKKTGELMAAVLDFHDTIRDQMLCGEGLRLQRIESDIASDVLAHFMARGIPVLVIHDSFIVQAEYQDELDAVMTEASRRHTGRAIPVK